METGLELEFHKELSVVIIHMLGEPQPGHAHQLDEILSKLRQENILYFILDLSDTRMINSQQIGFLVRHIQQLAERKQGGFAFVNPPDRVRYLLEITCAVHLAPIYDTVDAAFQSFNFSS